MLGWPRGAPTQQVSPYLRRVRRAVLRAAAVPGAPSRPGSGARSVGSGRRPRDSSRRDGRLRWCAGGWACRSAHGSLAGIGPGRADAGRHPDDLPGDDSGSGNGAARDRVGDCSGDEPGGNGHPDGLPSSHVGRGRVRRARRSRRRLDRLAAGEECRLRRRRLGRRDRATVRLRRGSAVRDGQHGQGGHSRGHVPARRRRRSGAHGWREEPRVGDDPQLRQRGGIDTVPRGRTGAGDGQGLPAHGDDGDEGLVGLGPDNDDAGRPVGRP